MIDGVVGWRSAAQSQAYIGHPTVNGKIIVQFVVKSSSTSFCGETALNTGPTLTNSLKPDF